MKKADLLILTVIVAAYIIFDKISDAGLSKEFLQRQDSLVHAVDSMKLTLALDSAKIDSLNKVDAGLAGQVTYWKNHQRTITKLIDSSKAVIDTYSEHQLVTFFNNRYPKDTTTNKLPLAQPVLTATAKDLAELDGAKQIITIKDSVIAVTEARLNGKDSVIAVYVKKEGTYKNIIKNIIYSQ